MKGICLKSCLFFQAEDGIRDAQESRGLGDVYKRQVIYRKEKLRGELVWIERVITNRKIEVLYNSNVVAVSYTHLTLPTIYSV